MAARTTAKGLGEVVLRVKDLDRMKAFYRDVLVLPVMAEFEDWVFFKLEDGHEEHARVVALVKETWTANIRRLKRQPVVAETTPLHHFALEISLADYGRERDRLESAGLEVTTNTYPWVHWRSLYVEDPEGNIVEFVAYDESVV